MVLCLEGTQRKHISVPNGVEVIGASAFSNCENIEAIELPDSVTKIGGCAFANCTGLTEIYLPPYITEIGGCAFSESSLRSIYVCGNYSVDDRCLGFCSATVRHKNTARG